MPAERKTENTVRQAIAEVLGPDALEAYSPAELKKLLGISASQETLRLILREGHTPRKSTLDRLLSEIHSARTFQDAKQSRKTAMDFYGHETRDELVTIFEGSDEAVLRIDKSLSREASDIVINQLGGNRLLVRCLDDSKHERMPPREYFDPAVAELTAILGNMGIDSAMLVTHTSPSSEVKAIARSKGVLIEEYASLIGSMLQLKTIKDHYDQKLKARDIKEGYQPQSATEVEEGEEPLVQDSFHRLLEFLENEEGPAVATILGSYGTGKTSLLLQIAHRVALRSVEAPNSWIVPIFVNAAIFDGYGLNIGQAFVAALQEIAPTCKIGTATFKRLVDDGRVWLFVDGLDESVTYRSQTRLVDLLHSLVEYCGVNGRLVLSARQEIFDNSKEERQTFISESLAAGARRTMVLRMKSLAQDQIENILRARLGAANASKLLKELEERPAIAELTNRPIFLHIIAQTSDEIIGREPVPSTRDLFEIYARRWVDREKRKFATLKLNDEERLAFCELMALYLAKQPRVEQCATAEDLSRLAINEASSLNIKNLPEFEIEARVSMFLERQPNQNHDCFRFSHLSLADFFLGRLLGREVADGKLLNFGAFPLPRSRSLLRHFTVDFIGKNHEKAVEFFENALRQQLSWEYELDERQLDQNGNPGPPFDVGPYRYVIANLAVLLLEARVMNGQKGLPIDLRGAHFAMQDLTEIFPSHEIKLLLDEANLEFAAMPKRIWDSSKRVGIIGPVNHNRQPQKTPDIRRLEEYCQVHDLFRHPRCSSEAEDRFILIPGGSHKIAAHLDVSDEVKEFAVEIPSFLIQKYPVTNAQFRQFLDYCPTWHPREVRRNTKNDYYLAGWPETESDPRLSDPKWLSRPVVYVNWFAARAYASANGLRLPTEVEWEVAARRAQGGALHPRPWGPELSSEWAHYNIPAEGEEPPLLPPASVYEIPPKFKAWMSTLGYEVPIHTVGLVREWVADHWDPRYPCLPQNEHQPYPVNLGYKYQNNFWKPAPEPGDYRVLRGGSFQKLASDITCHYRAPQRATNANPDAGFRCVRPIRVPLGLRAG